jgi:hypothetical protein
MRCRVAGIVALGGIILAGAMPSIAGADPPPRTQREPLDLVQYSALLCRSVADLRPPEIVEMVTALTHGSGLGPGEGWFHGGQSRHGWEWLAARHGIRRNGSISSTDFRGPADWFERLDRNRDGVLTAADFDSPDSLSAMQTMIAGHWFRMIDTNSNGRISEEEWKALFLRASKGKGYLTAEDLRDAFPMTPPPRPPGPPPKDDGPSPLALFSGFLSGELGSICEGPNIGQRAPDFTLPTQDGDRQFRLSQFRGKKPVVLIFGSFT